MKNTIGSILKEIRKSKNITVKELGSTILSSSQISNIEKSINIPSSDKLINLLNMLNITYEEFLILLDDEYFMCKKILKESFVELANLGNLNGLERLATNAQELYLKYSDIYFKHLELQILASTILYKSNYDFAKAKSYTSPIKDYLGKVENWGQYEISLFSNCLFMFEINDVLSFEKRIMNTVENQFDVNRSKDDMCILLNNLASYLLEHNEFYSHALKYILFCEEYASLSQNITQIMRARILKQVTYYKLNSPKFNTQKLTSFMQVFKVSDLDNLYENTYHFIKKYGIELDL